MAYGRAVLSFLTYTYIYTHDHGRFLANGSASSGQELELASAAYVCS